MEQYFESSSKLVEYLINEMKFPEDDAVECWYDMEDQEKKPYKRSTWVSGYIRDTATGFYYPLYYISDYDWGSSDFHLGTIPLEMKEEVQTITVKKFVPIKEEITND